MCVCVCVCVIWYAVLDLQVCDLWAWCFACLIKHCHQSDLSSLPEAPSLSPLSGWGSCKLITNSSTKVSCSQYIILLAFRQRHSTRESPTCPSYKEYAVMSDAWSGAKKLVARGRYFRAQTFRAKLSKTILRAAAAGQVHDSLYKRDAENGQKCMYGVSQGSVLK